MSKVQPVNKSFCLEKICESNYKKLFRLIPDLHAIDRGAIGFSPRRPDLHLEIVEKAPYTLTLQLSHCFNIRLSEFLEPAVKIRVYLDARTAEVIRDHVRTDVCKAIRNPGLITEIMDYKWTLNYFLDKWLAHCIGADYRFLAEEELREEALNSA
ncbi:MAG: DUF1249 domain-containing protein [Gammaproteobacteria bacterium]